MSINQYNIDVYNTDCAQAILVFTFCKVFVIKNYYGDYYPLTFSFFMLQVVFKVLAWVQLPEVYS